MGIEIMFNHIISDSIAFLDQNRHVINEGVELMIPNQNGNGYKVSEAEEVWDLDEDTPCEWRVVDEKTYNEISGLDFSVHFFHKDGKGLLVYVARI